MDSPLVGIDDDGGDVQSPAIGNGLDVPRSSYADGGNDEKVDPRPITATWTSFGMGPGVIGSARPKIRTSANRVPGDEVTSGPLAKRTGGLG